jgi:hypothetical protein
MVVLSAFKVIVGAGGGGGCGGGAATCGAMGGFLHPKARREQANRRRSVRRFHEE